MKMSLHLRLQLLLAALFFALAPVAAPAQVVTSLPKFVAPGAWSDLGNGPTEVLPVLGSGSLYTFSSTGVGSTSGSSTTLTLTASAAANPPCVGCIISGTGITSGTTVAAFNGTTTITLSAAMTVAASTPLAWGMACPTSGQVTPGQAGASAPLSLQAVGGNAKPALPMYTQGRLCAYGGQQAGLTFVNFAIGAW